MASDKSDLYGGAWWLMIALAVAVVAANFKGCDIRVSVEHTYPSEAAAPGAGEGESDAE